MTDALKKDVRNNSLETMLQLSLPTIGKRSVCLPNKQQLPKLSRKRRRNAGFYIALFALSVSSSNGFGRSIQVRQHLRKPSGTIFFSTFATAPGDWFSNNNESSKSNLFNLADNTQQIPNQAMQFLSAARKRLKRKNLTQTQRKDISQKIDETIRTMTDRAFAPPHNDPVRILSGVEVVNALCANNYGLCVPYNLIPIKTILSAITALTTFVKQFAKANPVLTKDERSIETRMANEAFRLLQRLVTGSGIRVRDPYVREAEFTRILDAFCTARRMKMAERVVALQDRASNAPPLSIITYSILIRGYGDIGDAEKVTRVFKDSQSRGIRADTVMMNSLIDAYIKCGETSKANTVFRRMKRGESGIPANVRTYNIILKGWAECGRLDQVQKLSKEMEQQPDLWDDVTVNSIVHAAVLQKDWVLAEKTLRDHARIEAGDLDRHPHVEAYTELLNGYAEAGMIDDALRVYAEMDQHNVKPTEITFCCILRVYGAGRDMSAADDALNRMVSMGITPSTKAFGALILGLTSSSSNRYRGDDTDYRINDAVAVLERMIDHQCFPPPTLIAVVLQFMSQLKEPRTDEALGLVEKMMERNVVQRGNVVLWTALMKYYASVGHLTSALATFQEIPNPDVAAVNELLQICSNSGIKTRVMDVFHRNFLPKGHLRPDIITFSCVITCLLSGSYSQKDFAEARKCYKQMKAASPAIAVDNAFVDVVLKQMIRSEIVEFLTRSDVYFIAAILTDAETLKWGSGQLERRKSVARGMLARRLEVLFGDRNFLDTLLPPDSDALFQRKGWNQVESGFKVWGMPNTDNNEDRFLEENGWNSVDSGFRLF